MHLPFRGCPPKRCPFSGTDRPSTTRPVPTGPFDPVTEADRRAKRAARAIEEAFPEDGIIGEEFGAVRADADYLDHRSHRWHPGFCRRRSAVGDARWSVVHGASRSRAWVYQPFIDEAFIASGA